jgi:putative flippase GtrA
MKKGIFAGPVKAQPSLRVHKARRTILGEFVYFAGLGAIGTFLQYIALIALVEIAGVWPVTASVVGFILGGFVNFYLNYRYTFQSTQDQLEAFTKFMVVALVGLALNTLIMAVAIEIFTLHYLFAQIIATGLGLVVNFAGNLLWTFRE